MAFPENSQNETPMDHNEMMENIERAKSNPSIGGELPKQESNKDVLLKILGFSSPKSSKPASPQKEEKKIEPPSIWKGAYETAKTGDITHMVGKSGPWKDFSTVSDPEVRKKMLELRDKFFPAGKSYINKRDTEFKVNELKRNIPYAQPSDAEAGRKFIEELKAKNLIK